jgi:hypothetical protein
MIIDLEEYRRKQEDAHTITWDDFIRWVEHRVVPRCQCKKCRKELGRVL